MKAIYYTGIFLLFISGCETIDYNPPEEQPVYFEYEYINYAWGYQHHGWIIDADGNIRAWNKPEGWQLPDSTGYIDQAGLEYNILQTDSVISIIDSNELMDHVTLITGAKNGFITEPKNIAADAGNSSLYAYWYDQDMDAYFRVFLGSSGDFRSINTSSEAKKLVSWLRQFGVFWL